MFCFFLSILKGGGEFLNIPLRSHLVGPVLVIGDSHLEPRATEGRKRVREKKGEKNGEDRKHTSVECLLRSTATWERLWKQKMDQLHQYQAMKEELFKHG